MASTKKIGLVTAIIVGMNAMIGAGIFSVPAALGSSVGPAGILTYLFVILAVWFMGSSMAELAQRYPEEGSFYTYTKVWAGHIGGLIAGTSYLIGLVIAMGLLVRIAGYNLAHSYSGISAHSWSWLTLGSLTALNILGVKLSEIGQQVLIISTVFPIIATTILCFMHGSWDNFKPFMPYGTTNVLSATKAVIFGFFGFESAASLFNIVEDPQKNVPRALRWALILVGILYLSFVASIIAAVPLEKFTDPSVQLSDLLSAQFPGYPWLITLIHYAILSAILGTVHSMIWGSSMLLVDLFRSMKNRVIQQALNNNYINQKVAVLIIASGIAFTYSTLRSIDLFFGLTAIFIIFSFMASMVTLLIERSNKSIGSLVANILGLATASIMLFFAIQGVLHELY